jgi:hypothetical protein
MSTDDRNRHPGSESLRASSNTGRGGGRGRQGVGEAFFMSLIRQIARSIGSAIVRVFLGGRR